METEPTPGPWMIADSCSWRRIMSVNGTMVCEPTIQRSDNHPDLHFRNGGYTGPDARLIAAAPMLLEACKKAFHELNIIRARDGVPYTHYHSKSDVTEEYFSSVVDECAAAISAAAPK